MLTTLLLIIFLIIFFLLRLESDNDDESDESDDDGSGSEFTFGTCFLHFDVEFCFDRVFSVRVGISSIVSRSSIFTFCSSIQVILSQVKISLTIVSRSIFSRSIFSRSNALIVSKSISLTYCLNANVSLIFLRSS